MTGNVAPFRAPRTPDWFEQEVKRRAAPGFDRMVIVTDHASDQMTARGVTRTMLLRVLRRGTVDGPKLKFDEAHASWVAPMVGVTAGVEVRVVCAIRESDPNVIAVTVVNHGAA
jgi:hypothetical protein